MSAEKRKVWVVGHKNPDTDSICAALSYAYLKNQTENDKTYVAKRAGAVNAETHYVLDYFGAQEPELVTYAGTQIKDINFRRTAGVSSQISLRRAWETMKKLEVVTLPVTNQFGKLEGIIVTKDIATSYMDVFDNHVLSQARTQYKNIAATLDGTIIVGNEHAYFVRGKVVVATSNPEYMADYIEDDDMVILGDREEAQKQAIESNASCLIIGGGIEVGEDVRTLAEKHDCIIITTPFDTFSIARLINQSMPIKQFMTQKNIITFGIEDYVDEVRETMSKIRHRDFPILNENGNYAGMVSRRNLMNMQKKQVILVDHNEKAQAVDGIDEAEILEIIDHHRLGSLETVSPVYFRNQPLGSTATIIYHMYQENQAEIDKNTAALLCSAIISDTLIFKSPTCTSDDVAACMQLAKKAELDNETNGLEMFRAGSNLSGKSAKEIFYQDYKKFSVNNVAIGVGQINSMSAEELEKVKPRLAEFILGVVQDNSAGIVYFLLTDIVSESSEVLCAGNNANAVIYQAFGVEVKDACVKLQGVVSRKKQFFPAIVEALQQ